MDEKQTHTPGPWAIYDRREVCGEIWVGVADAYGFEVSHAAIRPGCDEAAELGDVEANARLIAASPTMADYIARRAAAGDAEAALIMEAINASS